PLIEQKNKKKLELAMRTELKITEIINNFEKQKKILEKDHNDTWLMREIKFVYKKKSNLIRIATNYEEELELLNEELKYVIDTLRKDIEDKMNLDLEKKKNFKSKKLNLEKQINKLKKNDDFKMLRKIIDELIEENKKLRSSNHKNVGNITALNQHIQIYSTNFKK
ncbi:33582_t:CDS:1, partial [Racocetra persica]